MIENLRFVWLCDSDLREIYVDFAWVAIALYVKLALILLRNLFYLLEIVLNLTPKIWFCRANCKQSQQNVQKITYFDLGAQHHPTQKNKKNNAF